VTILSVTGREAIADWVESHLLLTGRPSIGFGALESCAEAEIGASSSAFGLALSSLRRRAQLLADLYPFNVTPVGIEVRADALYSAYAALLLLTPGGVARQLASSAPIEGMAVAFERVVCRAMEGLLGPGSVALRFGWPSEHGRPPDFPGAIRWLAARMGISPGSMYRPPRRRDGGVDIVAWRPFPDGRSGFPVVLVQCTLQQDVVSKATDIDLRNWAGWLTLDADPTIALAVPGTLPPNETWNEIAAKSLILERVRLVGLVALTPAEPIAGLQPEVEALVQRATDDR
jgi:hypothetical protein